EWDGNGPAFPYLRPNMQTGAVEPSVADPSAATLLSFFTMSDIHITDKESPAQCVYFGYNYPDPETPQGQPMGNSSAYSAIILYTPHVLDAAVQTINALHKTMPFDFGISLGDAANNTQYNELRWYIDVLDGKMITPSSGAHLGANSVDYQKPFKAAGLDKSIDWYQVIGNHDQFWMGSTHVNKYLRTTYVGPNVLNISPILSLPPNWKEIFAGRGLYMGLVDGTTKFGNVIDAGPSENFPTPPQIVADPDRRSLKVGEWMNEFFNTTSKPAGHGFTHKMVRDGFACYHFYPKADIPIKFIVLDDTDKVDGGAAASLDYERYGWLVQELDDGEAAGELMVICAHIPIRPYAPPQDPPPTNNPYYPFETTFSSNSDISEDELLAKLHSYKNLVMWCSGHIHRNTITPQVAPDGDPEHSFWEVETPSLRDFPRMLRRFEIVRNKDNNISIFALNVDVAVNPAPLGDGSISPAWTSRSYAIATQQIFQNPILQGPNVDPATGVYNAELVKQLSRKMKEKLAGLAPVVRSFKINRDAESTTRRLVTLNNAVVGTTPTHYMASESSSFEGAAWHPYSKTPDFRLRPITASEDRTVYFKVKDGSGKQSQVVTDSIHVG
ncbi:MAG: TIGR03768 family metallophosphoesterase, partial [Acidobacteriota bacterium]